MKEDEEQTEEQKKVEKKESGLKAEDLEQLNSKQITLDKNRGEEEKSVITKKDDGTVSEMKSVTTEMKSQKTNKTSSTVISKLQKQLDDEKKAREKLKEEIEELKKMNNELCNAILSTNSQISMPGS